MIRLLGLWLSLRLESGLGLRAPKSKYPVPVVENARRLKSPVLDLTMGLPAIGYHPTEYSLLCVCMVRLEFGLWYHW